VSHKSLQPPVLIYEGDLDGPTIELAGRVPDTARWAGTLVPEFEIEMTLIEQREPTLIAWDVEIEVTRTRADRWRWVGTYPTRSVLQAGDPGELSPEELIASYRHASRVVARIEVDALGVVHDSSLEGLDELGLSPVDREQTEANLGPVSLAGLPLFVPRGRLGRGAMWSRPSETLDGRDASTQFVLVDVDGESYRVERSIAPTSVNDGDFIMYGSGHAAGAAGLVAPTDAQMTFITADHKPKTGHVDLVASRQTLSIKAH